MTGPHLFVHFLELYRLRLLWPESRPATGEQAGLGFANFSNKSDAAELSPIATVWRRQIIFGLDWSLFSVGIEFCRKGLVSVSSRPVARR